jgi:hypothetical protein
MSRIFCEGPRVDKVIGSRKYWRDLRGPAALVVGVVALGACGGARPGSVGDGGVDAGPDLGVVVTGTRLLAGDLDVKGITSDGFVAVLDQSRGVLAVPLAGGPFQTVDDEGESAGVRGNVIASFRNYDAVARFGDVAVWTSAGGTDFPASIGLLAVNDDATRFLASTGSSSDATMTNLVVGGLDGADVVAVFSASSDASCRPGAAFVGDRFIVAHCDPGSTSATISSVDPVSGAVTSLLADAKDQLAVVPGATGLVVVIGANGDAFLTKGDGASMTVIGHEVDAAVATPDGSAVLLRARGVISRVDVATAQPVILVAKDAQSIWAASADGQSLLYRLNLAPRYGYGDLYLTSAVAPAAALTLSASLDTTTFGDAFTRDGSRVLYVTDADDLFVGTLRARAVTGDDAPATFGRRVWYTRAYADTRVAFTSDYVPVPERPGRAVLRVADTADGGDTSSIIATFAGADFFLTAAGDRVVFSFNDGTARAGLYVASLPGATAVEQDAAVSDVPVEAPDAADAGSGDADASSTSDATDAGLADADVASDVLTIDVTDSGPNDAPEEAPPESLDGDVDAAAQAPPAADAATAGL